MISRSSIMSIVRGLVGHENIVAIPKIFAQMLGGDWTAAAMLNQIIFWSGHTDDPNGWFYKTNQEWQDELFISQRQVERCLKVLKGVGISTLIYKVNGTPKTHFCVDERRFIQAMEGAIAGLHQNVKSDFTKTWSPTSPKREDSIRHRSHKTLDHKDISPAVAGGPPAPSLKKNPQPRREPKIGLCEIFHVDGDKSELVHSETIAVALAHIKAVEISLKNTTQVYQLTENGKMVAWYRGGNKISKPRQPDLIIDAIAAFWLKTTDRATINSNAGHITGSGANKAVLAWLREKKGIPENEPLSPELIANTAASISQGVYGIDSMGKWWDDNHLDGDGQPLARPNPHKFMVYYPQYREWMLAQMNKSSAPKAAKVNKVRWISEHGKLVRVYDPVRDGIPGQYTLVYDDPPEAIHE